MDTDTLTLDELIREVAAKHGVALGRGDPLMILPTINRRLAEQSAAAQQAALAAFQAELEQAMTRLGVANKDMAERAIGAAVDAARSILLTQAKELAQQQTAEIQAAAAMVTAAAEKAAATLRPLAFLAVGSAAAAVFAALVMLFILKV